MSNVFKRIEEEEARTLYKNEAIFSADYAPESIDEVLHRRKQIDIIARNLSKAVKGVRSELYVFGITGVGKTHTLKAVLNGLPKKWTAKIQYVWLNCNNIRPISEYQILNEISTGLGRRWKKGHSRKDLEKYIIRRHKEKTLVIILDEVDVLAKISDRLLYTFFEEGVSQILISNVFNWADECDDRIKSRSKGSRVDFGTYTKDEMVSILRFIADKGVEKGVLSNAILEKIVEYTIEKFVGDVRKAKFLMSGCVDEAMKEAVSKVTEEHLAKAYRKVQPRNLKNILKNFSLPEQIALAGFVAQKIDLHNPEMGKEKPGTTERIHYFYKCVELAGLEPVSETMMKNYLKRLESSGILEHETKSYNTSGRTNVYYSNYNIKDLATALRELGVKFPWRGDLSSVWG